MKSLINISALTIMCVILFIVTGVSAHAADILDYDADKVTEFASEHYNNDTSIYKPLDTDGNILKEDCVRFVRACVEEGGVPTESGRTWGYTPKAYVDYIVNNGYATWYKLKLSSFRWNSSRYVVDADNNIGRISEGDILVYKCTCPKHSENPYIHLAIVAETEGVEGTVTCYAHNKPQDKGTVITYPLSCGADQSDMEISVLHMKSADNGYQKVNKVTAKRAAYKKIKISWDAVDGADGYKLYKKTSKSGSWKLLIKTSKTSVTNTIATIGKTYYYRVRPYNDVVSNSGTLTQNGYYSKTVSGKTYLAKPSNVKVSKVGSGKLKTTWNKMAGATGYQVYRATSKNGKYTKILTTKKTSCTDSKRVKGKIYYYKVRSYNVSNGKTVYSSFSTVVGKKMK